MNLTNKYDIPKHLYDLILADITSDPYGMEKVEGATFRVTDLINPPYPKNIFKEKINEVTIDASHYLAMRFGTVFHMMMNAESNEDAVYEMPLKMKTSISINGKNEPVTIFGTADEIRFLDKNSIEIVDNKTCLNSQLKYDIKDDYVKQLNMYKYLVINDEDIPCDKYTSCELKIRYFIKDYSTIQAVRKNEPTCPIRNAVVPQMKDEEIKTFVANRAEDHITSPFRPCTAEERNFGSIQFAVMQTGKTRALRVLDSYYDAQIYIAALPENKRSDCRIVAREEDMKCKFYCQSVSVCEYAKRQGYKPL